MRRVLSIVVPLAGILVLAAAVSAWAGGDGRSGNSGKTLTVVEHATTDVTTDTGGPGDTAGDVLTFANAVFNAGDTDKVGTDQGYCIRVVKGAAYECTWTTFLAGGQIVVAGPFLDAGNSTLAITGGTGRYRGARGTMDLRSLAGGTKFAFVFHIKG
jgi:allene oxide cyclase